MARDNAQSRGLRFIATGLVIFSALTAQPANRTALTPAESRGKRIYSRGEASSGSPIWAVLAGGTEVAGSLMPCRNCHGPDGRGKPEGGVTPTSVRWGDLTAASRTNSAAVRRHGPYDESTLNRAIALGIDPAGNKLDAAMPRFRMGRADLDDLISWLKRIDTAPVEGITADSIVIGTLLQPGGPGASARAVLAAYFERIGASGGIYGRRIQFRSCQLQEGRSGWLQAIRSFLDEAQPFALVASYSAGIETELGALLEERELPLLGAYTLFPQNPARTNATAFYVETGLPGEVDALARYIVAANLTSQKRVALIVSSEQAYRAAGRDAKFILESAGWTVDEIAAGELLTHNAPVILLLAPSAAMPAYGEFQLLAPGTLVTEPLLNSSVAREGRLFLAYSVLPSDYESTALMEYGKLGAAASLPAAHRALQFSALAAGHILVEAMVRMGREASRDKLIEALESLYDFHTGFTPPVTFGPNRRIGIQRARVVRVDPGSGRFNLVRSVSQLRAGSP